MDARSRIVYATAGFMLLVCIAAVAAAGPAKLPDSAVGILAGELISHVNANTPAQVRRWAPTVLSGAMAESDQTDFMAKLAEAARDSGGLTVFDVRTDPRQPGLLEVAVQARRGGRRALLVVAADPSHPHTLATADLVSMPDPALYASWPKGPVSRAQLRRLIEAALDRLEHTEDFSGCLTVFDGKQTVLDECRGLADRTFDVPIDHRTLFHIGSIDKMFTAIAIAQLVEAGKLSWDDTLAQLVPNYPDHEVAKKITVWELLHHTSGLGDFLVPAYFAHRERYVDPADYLGLIARQPMVDTPGKAWHYSNAGYVLLGCIIENVSGEDYFEYIRQHVFAPAGMDHSGFDSLDEITPNLSVGYYRDGVFSDQWKADWMKIPYKGGPAGGGYSSNADLIGFARALRAGKLVKPATLAQMFDDEVPAGPGAYAAGFGDRLSHGLHIRGHAGGIEGTDADLAIVWETGAAVALTSNEGPGQYWLLAERIADLLAAEGAGRGRTDGNHD